MSESKWTEEQLRAINESGCNLLVAAAAGAGKTAVLVERIIGKITDHEHPIDIDRLLVVTFTNAAATEMRERLGEAISKALDKNPDSKQLQRQLALLNMASISTMHSFCLETIRNNFHRLDLDPNFRIADETEALLLKLELLDQLFDECYVEDAGPENFKLLVEAFGGKRDDSALKEIVSKLYHFVQSSPWPDKWLEEKPELFNMSLSADFSETPWAGILLGIINIQLKGICDVLAEAGRIAKYSEGLQPYERVVLEETEQIRYLHEMLQGYENEVGSWDKAYNAFNNFEFQRLPRCGKDADKEAQECIKNLRDAAKSTFRKLQSDILFQNSQSIIKDLNLSYPMVKCICQLVSRFSEKFAEKKKQRSMVDFNDLEHFCLRLLTQEGTDFKEEWPFITPSIVAKELRTRYEEILVDEYQDSNLVQEVIVSAISRQAEGNNNVFMVGDVKQSIYRFRQAKPELFMSKYSMYSTEASGDERLIQLYKNFRSRANILNFTNMIFKQVMSINVGELDYNENEALNPGAVFEENLDQTSCVGGAVEILLIDVSSTDVASDISANSRSGVNDTKITNEVGGKSEAEVEADDDEAEMAEADDMLGLDVDNSLGDKDDARELTQEELDSIQSEARLVAKRIIELTFGEEKYKVWDKNLAAYRQVEYKDIVVLLRTTRNWSEIFTEELSARGIPVYADTGTGYFKTVEIQTMISLLQIIDNPMQDIALLSVLRSPIEGFNTEELVDIRLLKSKGTFYEAMKAIENYTQMDNNDKVKKFLDKLEKWRDKSEYLTVSELLWYLYDETGYFSFVGAMPDGEQRQANLRLLFERARQYEQTSFKGLFNFINFINRLKSSSGDMGSAKILGENQNVVRIMSIHKSKGLEFPVVFVSGCGKKFNLQDANAPILFDQDLGLGPDLVDVRRRISYSTAAKQALVYKMKLETLSEEMRILYVAFTRAKEKLIITSTIKDAQKTAIKWCKAASYGKKLLEYETLKARSFIDWIGPAISWHSDSQIIRDSAGASSCEELDEVGVNLKLSIYSKMDLCFSNLNKIPGTESEVADAGCEEEIERENKYFDEIKKENKYFDEIKRRLEWKYKHEAATRLPTKLSVTELKRRFSPIDDETEIVFKNNENFEKNVIIPLPNRPAFLEGRKELTAAEKGTTLHFVMQHLKLENEMTEPIIVRQVEEMVKGEMLSENQAKTADFKRISRFFDGQLGKRMLAAGSINREVPFNLELSCNDASLLGINMLNDELGENETVLVQGVIDCFFEEDDELVLIDYKTDYIAPYGKETLSDKYRLQIELYSRALKIAFNKNIKGKYIYLFHNGDIIEYM